MSWSALDALRLGRRTQLQATAFAGVVWAIPAGLAMVVVAQLLNLSAWWVLGVGGLVLAIVFVRRRQPESTCVHAIDAGLKLQGAFELAVELERGRQVGARFQHAIEARVRGALTVAGVRRATWEFAPRFLIASLMISSILVVALGVVRNLQPKANAVSVATQTWTPLDRVALLQEIRRAREAGLVTERVPSDRNPLGLVEDDHAKADSSLAADDRANDPKTAGERDDGSYASTSSESLASSAKGAAEAEAGPWSDVSPGDASGASSVREPNGGPTAATGDSSALNPQAAPDQAAESAASAANLATDEPSGVTPEPNAGKLSAPVVPAWWPKRHRAVVEAVLRASP